jgi:methyl-accepting chemotaxis protein
MSSTPHKTLSAESDLQSIARLGDLVMLVTMFFWAAGALVIGQIYMGLGLAIAGSAALLTVAGATFALARGTTFSQIVMTTCSAAFVMLHIQLGRGTIEFHFGVFVLIGLLLVYRDWRAIVFGAALFAVHHVLFDRLQALNLGVYCTPQADLLKTATHAIYVVAQTTTEYFLALRLRRAAIEAAELSALVRSVDRGDTLCLAIADVPATSHTARILKEAIGKMAAAMNDVQEAAASIELAASELAQGNQDLSQRTDAQASNLQQTAASMEELTSTVRNTADTANQATTIAGTASDAAAAGGDAVGKVVATMSDISQSSRRIADITTVIDGIAFQTNILALNAAVEAARAGEQGRGFAIVAAEVRSLAQRSAGAAKEIKALIGESVERVETGARLVGAAGASMDGIVTQARRVSDLIGEISSATSEQTTGISQVGDAVQMLDRVTQQNAELVQESAVATDGLKQQATRLSAVVGRFALA